jgi:ABC-type nitrate/sulfonate/bicarbonate transport system permease component
VPVGVVVAAEIAAQTSHLQSDSLAAPSEILIAGAEALRDGSLLTSTYETLASAAGGLAIGFVLGLALGIMLGLFRILDRLLEVTVESIRPIPSVALIPIALLVYGFGYRMEIAVIAFATLWPALILARAAIAGVEPRLFEVSRALQMSLPANIFKIAIPAALPRIFVALRLGIGISLIVAVTVEISANTIGLGHAMMEAGQSLRPALMLAYLVWVGLLGLVVNWLMLLAQKHLFGPAANVEAQL